MGDDYAGLSDEYDKIKRPEVEYPPRQWSIAEIATINRGAKKASEIPPLKEVNDIPVRGQWDKLNGYRYYFDSVTDYGVVGYRCYLTVRVNGENHNVHVPDDDDWSWLKSAVIKRDRSGVK